MKQIKAEYRDITIFNGKIGRDIQTKDIEPNQYEFYIKNGLGFIFEEICLICHNVTCTCEDSKLDEAKEEIKEYTKPSKKK